MILTRPFLAVTLLPGPLRFSSVVLELWGHCGGVGRFEFRRRTAWAASASQNLQVVRMASSHKEVPVAVVGAGVSGCVCASTLAERGIPVTLFDMGRGPGGRMSSRREATDGGKEFLFDHGAQYFSVRFPDVQKLVDRWLAAGLVKEWKGKFGSYDRLKMAFQDETFEDDLPKYVGVPSMNSICKAMSRQPGIRSEFGTTVASVKWKEEGAGGIWHLRSKTGEDLGAFRAVVVADKGLASDRFTATTGLPPPLEKAGVPTLYEKMANIKSVSVFVVMVAFAEPLTSVPFDRFTIERSNCLSGAVRLSNKPGRKVHDRSECWVLHSTVYYANDIIKKEGLAKPSSAALDDIANTLFKEFQEIVPAAPTPLFIKAHRWGSAFPMQAAAPEEHCLVESSRKMIACGDYCVGPRIECAILSGLAAARNMQQILDSGSSKI
ncbi:hypothetical protein R1sor_018476 [Riccia sorocarpa]|uniref:Amine oxidase domain-containing protein n=1 Tax=Riccia sorocarpa TaxID=122646 RepID=A0ABD3ID32_9MARC